MRAHTVHQGRLVAAGLALAAVVVAVVVAVALSDPRAGSLQAPSGTTSERTSTQRSVIVRSGRAAKGRSVTVQGAPGESVTAPSHPGGAATVPSARGGAGGSASARGGSTTSGSVVVQGVGP